MRAPSTFLIQKSLARCVTTIWYRYSNCAKQKQKVWKAASLVKNNNREREGGGRRKEVEREASCCLIDFTFGLINFKRYKRNAQTHTQTQPLCKCDDDKTTVKSQNWMWIYVCILKSTYTFSHYTIFVFCMLSDDEYNSINDRNNNNNSNNENDSIIKHRHCLWSVSLPFVLLWNIYLKYSVFWTVLYIRKLIQYMCVYIAYILLYIYIS